MTSANAPLRVQDGGRHERLRPVERLDSLFSPSLIAHEAIFDLHRELVSVGRDTERSHELLEEAARVILRQLPELAEQPRNLAIRWEEQNVLDPGAADETLHEFAGELERVEPQVACVRDRQREIAASLRSMLER